MAVKNTNSSTLTWFVIILLFAAAGAILLFPIYRDLQGRRRELHHQQELLNKKKTELLLKQTEVSELKNSPAAVERVAREKLHLVRRGESVMFYDEPKKGGVQEK